MDHFLKQLYQNHGDIGISTLNSMFPILPRRSVSASTGWGCRGRRTAAVGEDDGDGGPGTTGKIEGKLQKNGSIVRYCGRGHGSFIYRPTSTYILRIIPSGIPAEIHEPGIPEQINLALE